MKDAGRYSQQQAKPLRFHHIRNAQTDGLDFSKLRDLRDIAIAWLAYDVLGRRSEMAALNVEDIGDVVLLQSELDNSPS
jgi:hypothetical protein